LRRRNFKRLSYKLVRICNLHLKLRSAYLPSLPISASTIQPSCENEKRPNEDKRTDDNHPGSRYSPTSALLVLTLSCTIKQFMLDCSASQRSQRMRALTAHFFASYPIKTAERRALPLNNIISPSLVRELDRQANIS
jgi:hypothetical protein